MRKGLRPRYSTLDDRFKIGWRIVRPLEDLAIGPLNRVTGRIQFAEVRAVHLFKGFPLHSLQAQLAIRSIDDVLQISKRIQNGNDIPGIEGLLQLTELFIDQRNTEKKSIERWEPWLVPYWHREQLVPALDQIDGIRLLLDCYLANKVDMN
jgi:hypothetical protein